MNNVYRFSHSLVRSVYHQLFEGDIRGLNNIPREGPCILAVNHASHFDPPMIGSHVMRPINFFARKTLWNGRFFSWWLDAVGTIPVDRDGDSDIAAMKRVLGTLKEGGLVTLFPEGTRSRDGQLQKAKPGIGLIAAKSEATVVPCRIFNSHKVLTKGSALPRLNLSIHMAYGKPIPVAEYDPGRAAGKERFQIIADRIMERIAQISRPRTPVI